MLENFDMKTWWIIGAAASVILIGVMAWLIAFVSSNDKDENRNEGKEDWHM